MNGSMLSKLSHFEQVVGTSTGFKCKTCSAIIGALMLLHSTVNECQSNRFYAKLSHNGPGIDSSPGEIVKPLPRVYSAWTKTGRWREASQDDRDLIPALLLLTRVALQRKLRRSAAAYAHDLPWALQGLQKYHNNKG